MAQRLGGEVGVERTSSEIEGKYRRIGELNRRKGDRFVPPARPSSRESERPVERPRRRRPPERTRPRYMDRVRMDFLASRPDHQIKTRRSAYAALFSPFMSVRDLVNPRLITQAEEHFFRDVENLVLSVRQLLVRYRKSPRTLLRIPYYQEVATVIKEWDLEGLNRELARLEIHPRGLPIEQCRELCRLIYRPIVRLLDLDPTYHIAQALKHLHDVDLLSLPKDSPEVPKIKLAYTMSREAALRVFIDRKRHLYPLLMKLAVRRFSAYSDFFLEHREEVLEFLSLGPSDLLRPKMREEIVPKEPPPESEAGEVEADQEGEDPGKSEDEEEMPEELTAGLELLDELFPQAGFLQLDELPDLYPYFQPIVKLPRGSELISPQDPLQQLMVIVACLQEIFYGFRSIVFQNFGDEESGVVPTASLIERLTGSWHLFLDEILGKHYVSSLFEYCRQVEQGISTLRASNYAARHESQLMWMKRHFFLPHLPLRRFRGLVRPTIPSDLPRLSETVADLRELLERVVGDIASGECRSLQNPWQTFSFAVDGYLSKRVRLVLGRRAAREPFGERRTSNASLILHTLLIVRSLDYLINDERSFYTRVYEEAGRPLFRADSGKPLYNVAIEDSIRLIEQTELRRLKNRHERSEENRVDDLTRMQTTKAMTTKVRSLMGPGAEAFVLLTVTLRRYRELGEERGSDTAEGWLVKVAAAISSEIRDYEDIPYRVAAGAFIVVMPETTAEGAIHLAERLLERFRELESGQIPISMGIVEHYRDWSLERLFRTTQAAVREAARLPSPSLVCHEPVTDTFVPHSPQEKR